MPQGVLPFKYQEEKKSSGMTSLAGLPTYLELAYVAGLRDSIRRHIGVTDDRGQGWTDSQIILSLVLLNLAGGDCVEDLDILEMDSGFVEIFRKVEDHGLSCRERRELEKRWRRERTRALPSSSPVFRFLSSFHNSEEEKKRKPQTAFIPASNRHLRGLKEVNKELVAFVQKHKKETVATLDMDATLVETNKEEAFFCYKGFNAYQPLNVYWYEQDQIIYSEFRDGNVPANYELLRVFEESLNSLPEGVEKVYLRIDGAGYQKDLLKYCAEGKNNRFGVIEFAVSSDVNKAFKNAVSEVAESDWEPLYRKANGKLIKTKQEWTEVCFVPTWAGYSKKTPDYRFLAIRESLSPQLELPGMEEQLKLPFPTMYFKDQGRYKIFGVVTNRDIPGDELIRWHRERCGKSEEVHSVMKKDLAGGKLPSSIFGANAAWWGIMILALNLNSAMKHLVLGENWVKKRMKAIRFHIINLPGRIIKRSRELILRLIGGHPSNEVLFGIREKILSLARASPG